MESRSNRASGLTHLAPVVALLALAIGGPAAAQSAAGDACAKLAHLQIPASAVTLPTRGAVVETATRLDKDKAGAATRFCAVVGRINPIDPAAPAIRFQVNLPEQWNGRALQVGGGGYNGKIPETAAWSAHSLRSGPTQVAQGYMTLGDDSGHQAANGDDASFALNDEALANFGALHIRKTHDVAMALAKARYGRTPKHFYFAGGSTGGREALTAAQRYPDAYDGVIVNYPTADFLGLRLWGAALASAIYPDKSAGWIPPALVSKIAADAMAACDMLDGAADKIVSNMAACRAGAKARVEALRCKGAANDQCLTAAQIDRTIAVYHEGYATDWSAAGRKVHYQGYNSLEGVEMNLGTQAEPKEPLDSGPNAHHADRADQFMKFFVTRNPTFPLLSFDVHKPGALEPRLQKVAELVGAASPNFDRFFARGGKILWAQGLDDVSVSPYDNLELYQNLVGRYGQANADRSSRFYLVPGLGHGIGVFLLSWDNVKALDDWVDKGAPPPAVPVAFNANPKTPAVSRPLCVYPTWARYVSGDPAKAASFQCVR